MPTVKHSLEDQIILHESLKLHVYRCPAGYLTIGVGRNLEGKPLNKVEQEYLFGASGLNTQEVIDLLYERGITKNEAVWLLRQDINDAVKDLRMFAWFDRLDPVRRKVMIDMRYNLGSTRFREFKRMLAALDDLNFYKAADEMVDSQWYKEVKTRGVRLAQMMRTGKDYS